MTEGRKDDQAKLPFDLIPYDALLPIAEVLQFGAAKYSERNWEKGMRWGRVYAALMRHLISWFMRDIPTKKNYLFGDLDSETELSHLAHAGCCILFLISYELRGAGTDDRPYTAQANRSERTSDSAAFENNDNRGLSDQRR
jgi:hypothetical protein